MSLKIGKIFLLILFIYYFIATLFISDFWGYILSPMVTLIAAVLIFIELSIKVNSCLYAFEGLLISLGVLMWAIADILLAIEYFFIGENIGIEILSDYIYDLTNIFFFITVSVFMITRIKKVDLAELFLNIFTLFAGILILIWVAFFGSSFENIRIVSENLESFIILIIDFLIFIEISIHFAVIRKKKIPFTFIIFPISLMLFVTTDIVYIYLNFFGNYRINSIIDSIFVFSFVIMANSMIGKVKPYEDEKLVDTTLNRHNSLWALLFPILIIVLVGFDIGALFAILLLLTLYFLASAYIQKSYFNKNLLIIEENNNRELEEKVKERTKELNHLLNINSSTGIYNGRYFLEATESKINNMDSEEKMLLLYIDIDRFRIVKMLYGNNVADKLLWTISERLFEMKKSYT